MSNSKQKEIFILLLCLLIGFALRFYTFDRKSLWLDEIHTFNDSRSGFKDQLKFYEENPYYLHPPLFFLLTHQFYPFTKPERDLRIIPLIFGTLSIPMIYLLARTFSSSIALLCALSLTFMAYHIYLSQDGRSYALLLFLGISGLYFFMRHLKTLKIRFLFPAAFLFATLFYTSYSSIPFIVFFQILWVYKIDEEKKNPPLFSFLIFNGLLLLFCLPWIIFLLIYYEGQSIMPPFDAIYVISFQSIIYGIFHDWVPYLPLMIISAALLILFPFFSREKRNALALLAIFLLPIGGLYLFCKLFNITHFVGAKYFINFLPLFFISLYLSLHSIRKRLDGMKRFARLELLFIILFIASNLVILLPYYRSEKQDFRSLVAYLKNHLRDGDKVVLRTPGYIPGLLHYFGVYPEGRFYLYPTIKVSENETEYRIPLIFQNKKFIITFSKTYWIQYATEGNRLWLIVGKTDAKTSKENPSCILKGYFDGSFAHFNKFPNDVSMYLFLWDPKSPNEKGIDLPID
jgi:hypothetical protein